MVYIELRNRYYNDNMEIITSEPIVRFADAEYYEKYIAELDENSIYGSYQVVIENDVNYNVPVFTWQGFDENLSIKGFRELPKVVNTENSGIRSLQNKIQATRYNNRIFEINYFTSINFLPPNYLNLIIDEHELPFELSYCYPEKGYEYVTYVMPSGGIQIELGYLELVEQNDGVFFRRNLETKEFSKHQSTQEITADTTTAPFIDVRSGRILVELSKIKNIELSNLVNYNHCEINNNEIDNGYWYNVIIDSYNRTITGSLTANGERLNLLDYNAFSGGFIYLDKKRNLKLKIVSDYYPFTLKITGNAEYAIPY